MLHHRYHITLATGFKLQDHLARQMCAPDSPGVSHDAKEKLTARPEYESLPDLLTSMSNNTIIVPAGRRQPCCTFTTHAVPQPGLSPMSSPSVLSSGADCVRTVQPRLAHRRDPTPCDALGDGPPVAGPT